MMMLTAALLTPSAGRLGLFDGPCEEVRNANHIPSLFDQQWREFERAIHLSFCNPQANLSLP
jgi:hypothetical protein